MMPEGIACDYDTSVRLLIREAGWFGVTFLIDFPKATPWKVDAREG